MTKKRRISRHGLTLCPSCNAHIQARIAQNQESCPLCRASLSSTGIDSGGSTLRKVADTLVTGRSGIMVASLFGASTLMGCPDDSTSSSTGADAGTDTVQAEDSNQRTDTSPELDVDVPESDSSPPSPDAGEPDTGTPPDQPLYGAPADIMEPTDTTGGEDTTADTAADTEDATFQPVYGAPSDAVTPPDTSAKDTSDAAVQPVYGAPADIVAADAASDATKPDISDAPIQPVYGAPADIVQMDTSDSKDSSDTGQEPQPQPLYGAVPADIIQPTDSSDASSDGDGSSKDTKEAIPQPVYGAVPNPKDAN